MVFHTAFYLSSELPSFSAFFTWHGAAEMALSASPTQTDPKQAK
jgi:hypothetical protein